MAHVREQLRDRVITLVTGLTTTGTNVFRSRYYPMEASKLPGLAVYTINERSELDTMGLGTTPTLERRLDLVIEGYAQALSDIDETLDDIALEVENAIGADSTLNSLCRDCYLTETSIKILGDGDKPIGAVRLVFEINYRTQIGDSETSV